MTIFQLLVYSCVSMQDFGGDLLSMTCRWDLRPDYFSTKEKCEDRGAWEIGKPIFSDIKEDRKVQKFNCRPIGVQ